MEKAYWQFLDFSICRCPDMVLGRHLVQAGLVFRPSSAPTSIERFGISLSRSVTYFGGFWVEVLCSHIGTA